MHAQPHQKFEIHCSASISAGAAASGLPSADRLQSGRRSRHRNYQNSCPQPLHCDTEVCMMISLVRVAGTPRTNADPLVRAVRASLPEQAQALPNRRSSATATPLRSSSNSSCATAGSQPASEPPRGEMRIARRGSNMCPPLQRCSADAQLPQSRSSRGVLRSCTAPSRTQRCATLRTIWQARSSTG